MNIFILRHGDANTMSKRPLDDSKRSLSDRGINEIENVSSLLSSMKVKFDVIYSSPLKRAKQSAEIIANVQKKSKIIMLNELKPEGNKDQIYKILLEQKEEANILIVGHNPLLIDITNGMITSEKLYISLKTGGLIKIKTLSRQPQLRGELELLLSPKLVRKISK